MKPVNALFLLLHLMCGVALGCNVRCFESSGKALTMEIRSQKPKGEHTEIPAEPKIEWLDHASFRIGISTNGEPYKSVVVQDEQEYELGLREDGTVVWRRKEKEKK